MADYVHHCNASVITIVDGMDSPVVSEDSINFLCKAQTYFYFNALSVPFRFTELLGYYITVLMGKKFDEIITDIDHVSSYLSGKMKK